MQQITNIQDLRTAVNENGEMVITLNSEDDIIIMKMDEYRKKMIKEDIEKHLLKAEDDIKNGRVREAREVFKEWKEQYGI
jgi:PHD/YefM family antitoxin component YafN of YafNO toxin-antitoxin module